MKNTIQIKLDNKIVDISKLPIGKYAELLEAIENLPNNVKEFGGQSTDEILLNLPTIIRKNLPDFINLITIATPLEKAEVEELGLDEVVKIVLAVVKVNKYKEVYEEIKKALARPVQINPVVKSGSIGQ